MKPNPRPRKHPHPVDEKLGFVDSVKHTIAMDSNFAQSYGLNFDRMMIGRVTDGKRYMGNGCYQKIETP